jgi:hypothetical protein
MDCFVSVLGLGWPSRIVFLRSNLNAFGTPTGEVCKSSGKVGLDTVYALCFMTTLAIFANRGGAFFVSPIELESRLDIFPF